MHDIDILPEIDYNGLRMKDISRRFVIKYIESRNSKPYWFIHRMTGWKSIENVAYDFYGSCDYIWAIMMANNIVHPIHDWLKTNEEVMAAAERKYGRENLNAAHHYEYGGLKYTTKMKTIVDARNTGASFGHYIPKDVVDQVMKTAVNPVNPIFSGDIEVVTNIEYEFALNEKKRYVKIIYPSLIPEIEREMEKLF